MLDRLDQLVDRVAGDHALLDQRRLEGHCPQFHLGARPARRRACRSGSAVGRHARRRDRRSTGRLQVALPEIDQQRHTVAHRQRIGRRTGRPTRTARCTRTRRSSRRREGRAWSGAADPLDLAHHAADVSGATMVRLRSHAADANAITDRERGRRHLGVHEWLEAGPDRAHRFGIARGGEVGVGRFAECCHPSHEVFRREVTLLDQLVLGGAQPTNVVAGAEVVGRGEAFDRGAPAQIR